MTLPELFAIAHGQTCIGEHRCRFCGSPANQPHTLSESFTAIDTLAAPQSGFICAGCLLCLEEEGKTTFPNGEEKEMTRSFRRSCSWVITENSCTGFTKSHTAYLREIIIHPPEPPFAISIAVSGQKHVLYRGVVCHSQENLVITLEGEKIAFEISDLLDRLDLCGYLIAATGKPALEEKPDPSFWHRVAHRSKNWEELLELWQDVWQSPLSKLAVFLSPKKEDCELAFTKNLA